MKPNITKLLSIIFALLSVSLVQAKDPMTLESGSLATLTDASQTVYFTIDYSNATVHNDGNKYTLDEYLEHRGPDFVADWKKDQAKAYSYLPVRYNQKNKKGAKALEMEGPHTLTATIKLTDIDFGNGGGTFTPFASAKAGGCIISGTLTITDAQGSEIAVLPFTEVKGLGHPSETIRLGMAYFELMNKLGDVIKQESKKKK